MKKIFSLIALVGIIAACTPEQVRTAFSLSGGKVLVNVEVVDIINGGTYSGPVDIRFMNGGMDITEQGIFVPITGGGPHAYMVQADESMAVAGGDYGIVVKGEKLAQDYSSAFVLPAVLAGGEAEVKVIVPVGEPLNGWTPNVQFDEINAKKWNEILFLANSEYPTTEYSHAGIDSWYYNNSEFLLDADVKYWLESYAASSNKVKKEYLGFEKVVDTVEEALLAEYPWDGEEKMFSFKVSAWAMWNVTQTYAHDSCPVLVSVYKDANNNKKLDEGEKSVDLGGFTLEYVESSKVEPHELPYPGAEGHYTPRHGQDSHGEKPNAGGGMSVNE